MSSSRSIKEVIKEKYGSIAKQTDQGDCGCGCGCMPTTTIDYTVMSDDYTSKEGYVPEADLGLGCGTPTDFANIQDGETVLDLGAGAGNDVFVARKSVGDTGKVIGLDMTPEMIEKARKNTEKLGYKNVEFILGEIEEMPISDNSVDVILSNCVLNLVPSKEKAFSEMYRVMKSGGRFSVSDIVLNGELPEGIKSGIMMYVGCVAGASQKSDYLKTIENAGFKNIKLNNEKAISLPDDVLLNFINEDELTKVRANNNLVESITVYAEKII